MSDKKNRTFTIRLSPRGMIHVEMLVQDMAGMAKATTIVRQAAEHGLKAMAKGRKGSV